MAVTQARDARVRIMAAASALFLASGIRAISLDDIAAKAGVTKKTVYYHFASKDVLVAAWLTQMSDRTFAAMEGLPPDPAEAIRTVFAAVAPVMLSPEFRGCPFLSTSVELADRNHPAHQVAATHKSKRLAWFRGRLADLGHEDPDLGAAELSLIWDGALALAVFDKSGGPVKMAMQMVERVLAR